MINYKSFSDFFYFERINEKENFNFFIKDIIISNFNNLLQNIIPSFGNDFFERIIQYNENFKISSLYNSLKYSLISTIKYYLSLYSSRKINSLTKDLKLKIYRLNDLDLTIDKKNKESLEFLNKKVNEFINESNQYLVSKYIFFFSNDVSIQNSFDPIVLKIINKNLFSLENELKDNYLYLNKYLKEKLIISYSKVMNQKTSEIVLNIEEKRKSLKSKFDDIFILEPDITLNDINNKINNTLNSINEFNSHFNTFKISENLPNFLNNFGINYIYPEFSGLINLISKNTDLKTIDKNFKDYLNYLNIEEFTQKSDNIHSKIETTYIEYINNIIDNYGKEQYPNNLELEINRIDRNHHFNEEEIENISNDKIYDKTIDDAFNKLLASSNNLKTFIYNLETFNYFDNIINENINKLNIAYKQSLKIIKDNDYNEEVYNNLTLKLSELKDLSLDYYTNINISFYDLKNYLKTSIYDINFDLNKCANITYTTLAKKYESLSNVENINTNNGKNIQSIYGSVKIENQNKITTVDYEISNILLNIQFIFNIEYEEGQIKRPKVRLTLINRIRPHKIHIKFIDSGVEKDIIEEINAYINNVNLTTDIFFITNSTNIYVTTIIDCESYQYSTELFELKFSYEEQFLCISGICFSLSSPIKNQEKIILSHKQNKTFESKHIVEKVIYS